MFQEMNARKPWFSFRYGGQPLQQIMDRVQIDERTCTEKSETIREITYRLEDGLTVYCTLRFFADFDACHWVLRFKNDAKTNSKQISDVLDCDYWERFRAVPVAPKGFRPSVDAVRVYKTEGSNNQRCEFHSWPEALSDGMRRTYACSAGRSSNGLAPFFDIEQDGRGILMAIGWTGQWNAAFQACDGQVHLTSGVEKLDFYLRPCEEVRTSSTLLMRYEDGQNEGHNRFRRLIRHHFSLIGQPGRPQHGPLCAGAWGSLSTALMCDRIRRMKKADLGLECYWIDAGWYGHSQQKCENEFVGDWWHNTGSWNVNPLYHPDSLKDVAQTAREQGMGLLLWMEPERVLRGTDTPKAHPEWFLEEGSDERALLLNLGDACARQGAIDIVSEKIELLDLFCYRQDFNCSNPLAYWRRADEPGRNGITELKYIAGLYQFWDALLARFPHLMIDNCASGGKRIDIETLSRSMPMWRSDYQCVWDCDPETTQVHNTGISWWLPYSGTGMGKVMLDTYRARSCYSASLRQAFWMYEEDEAWDDERISWARDMFKEYLSVRSYFSCDYYPLTYDAVDDTTWCGWQYHCPEDNDGIVLLFRRSKSPFDEATLALGGITADENIWIFEDADSKEIFRVSGRQAREGMRFHIDQPRSSRLIRYRKDLISGEVK